MALIISSLLFDSSAAYALSASCTTLNGLSGSGTFSRSFPAGTFAPGESVSVTFSDNGGNVGNGNPSSADNVILRNPTTFTPYFDYRSNTGSAGSHTGSASASNLAGGLFISTKVGTYLSTVTISCGAAVSSDASLSNLVPSSGTLSPSFSPGTGAYNVAVASNVSLITFTPTATDSNAMITVNGVSVISGATSPPISLSTGPNIVSVMGTAQDGTTTQPYSITVTRAIAAPDASNVIAAVAANSSANSISLALTGGTATSVAVATNPLHGVATANGTAISYTPTAGFSGTDSFTYTASNSAGTSSPATVIINVTPPTLVLTPNTLPAGQVGNAYSQSLSTAGGTAPYSYASSGSVPAGLNLDSASGTLSGTPTLAGSYNFTITVTDSLGAVGSTVYSVNIAAGALPVAGAVSATVAANASTAVPLALSGGAASSVTVASSPLHGSAVASGTTVTYTPVAGYSGTDSFTYTASNASGTSTPATVSIMVTAPTLVLTPSTLPAGQVGNAYSQSLSTAGGTAPYSYASSGSVPAGLNLDSASGTLSGTPTSAGSYSFTITATDSHGATGSSVYSVNIAAGALPVAGPVSATVAANASTAVTLALSGGAANAVAVASAPLHGSAVASGTTITYTPVAGYSGTDSFTYTASNASGTSAPATVSITVTAPTLVLTPSTLPAGQVGNAYSQSLSTAGGTAPYSYASSGSVPAGLNLDSASGTLSGTPTLAGSYNFTITATDSHGATGSRVYSVNIAAGAVPVAGPVSATVAANASTAVTLALSGGTASSVTVASSPLHGSAVVSGTTITYTPVAGYSGTDSFTYTASNTSGTSAPATVTLTVTAPTLVLTPAPGALPAGQVGTAYSQTLSVSGGTAPYAYTSSGVPTGMSLDAVSGALSGTPASPGSHTISVTVTDRYGAVGNASYTLNIIGGPLPVANPVSASVAANSSGSVALSLAGGTATSVAVASAPMHGTAVARGLTITYTPVAGFSGADSFTYTASNASGTSPAATVNLTISAPTLIISPATGSLPAATVGTRYSQALSVTGGSNPYRFNASGLPLGLGIDASSGTISGTPSDAGSATIAVQITDASGVTLNVTYTLSIGGTLPSGIDRSASLYAGQAVTVNLADGVSGGPFTGAALLDTPSKAMGQATLSGMSLTFTAAAQASGAAIIRYTLNNRWGTSQPITLTLQVAGRSDPSKDQEVIGMLGAQAQSAARFARAQIDNFNDRLEQLHDNEHRRGNSFNLQLGLPESRQSRTGNTSAAEMYQALSSLGGSDHTASPQLSAAPGSDAGWLGDENLSLWSGGYVNVSDTRRDDVKLDSTMVGMSAGADYRFFDAFTAGIGFGYGRDSSDIGSEGSHSKGDSFSGAIYGSFHPGRVFIDGLLGYSSLSFDSRRYVTDNGGYAKGSRDGDQFFGSLSSGYEFREDTWRVAPYGRVDVSSTKLDGFRESGSGAFDLAYADQRMNVLSGTGGLRGQYALSLKPTELTLRGRLEYSHTFSGDSTARMGYVDISDSTYGVSTQGQSDNLMTVALGADVALPRGLTTGVTYQGSFGLGDDSRSHALMLRLGTQF